MSKSTQEQFLPTIINESQLTIGDSDNFKESLITIVPKEVIDLENITDLQFLGVQENIKIAQIRQLKKSLSFYQTSKKPRVVALWKIDQASIPAQNSLLKIIEEPPKETLILLITAQPQLVLDTIKSRCQTIYSKNDQNSNAIAHDISQIATTIQDPLTTYSQLIEIAQEYKDRDQAAQLISQLIYHFHHQTPSLKNSIVMQNLQLCLQRLKANVNVRLGIENCFFTIKQAGL